MHKSVAAWLTIAACVVLPSYALAKTATTTPVAQPSATISPSPILSLNAAATITGTASTTGLLYIWVTNSAGGVAYQSDVLVRGNNWRVVLPALQIGAYTISLASSTHLVSAPLATSSLTIGLSSVPQVDRSILPLYDVADGKLMRFVVMAKGATPVSLDKLTFAFDTTAASVDALALYVFTDSDYTQPAIGTDGIAAQASVDSVTSVGMTPDAPIVIPAGATYYFELDGAVTPSDTIYSVLTTLLGDDGYDMVGTADQLASSSNFVWSPNTYGPATSTDALWLNAALVPGLSQRGLSQGRSGTPPPPSCTITSSASTILANQPFTLQWSTTNAYTATWGNGPQEALQGSKTVTNLASTHTYLLTVTGDGDPGTCYTTVVVGAATTTQQATTTPPVVDSFTATPTTGNVSLAVSFSGTVNNSKSCAATTYYFGYGDAATSTIVVAKNVCKAQSFVLAHTYTKVGTYTAALYNGVGTSTSQLIQKTTITVKAKGAFVDIFANTASVFNAVPAWLMRWTVGVEHWLGL